MEAPFHDMDAQRSSRKRKFRFGVALFSGSCLGLVLLALVNSTPAIDNTNAVEPLSLYVTPTTFRAAGPMFGMPTMRNLPGSGPYKDLALAAIEASGKCTTDRAAVAKAVSNARSSADRAVVAKSEAAVRAEASSMLKSGITAPWGFWDPGGLSMDISEGRLLFFREAELKHGRVCMLAFLGIIIGENYHPLFGGNIDVPAGKHFTLAGGDIFWVAAWAQFIFASFWEEKRTMTGVLEGTAFTGLIPNDNKEGFVAKSGRIPGDIGFDPLGLKPKTEKDLIEIQNKELNNGRLAMIAVIGVLAQESVTGEKIFR